MTAWLRWFTAALAFAGTAVPAAPQFPALAGRVVDEAGILSATFEAEIGAQLAVHEQATTNQVVVVTLKSLGGYDIGDYGYQLGRHWGIGQKGKNNGVLLIVAPNERKMRIEVGYGLEGALTDAISRDIIERRLKPAFRQQNFEQGIRDGVGAILAALAGEYRAAPPPVTVSEKPDWLMFLPFVFFVAIPVANRFVRGIGGRRAGPTRAVASGVLGTIAGLLFGIVVGSLVVGLIVGILVFVFTLFARGGGGRGGDWGSGGGWGGGGGGGGGFSGGGGSFGGGGASGGW